MFGKRVNFYFSTGRHYCIEIQPNKVNKMDLLVDGQSENVIIFDGNMNLSDKKNKYKRYIDSLGMHQVKTSED